MKEACEEVVCSTCSGSGEGVGDRSRCWACKGTGILMILTDEEPVDDGDANTINGTKRSASNAHRRAIETV